MDLNELKKSLGYPFNDQGLLERALTRKAYALEQKEQEQELEDQEIFRTLGDAILKAVLVDLLIQEGCKTRDEITKKKIELEREETLAKISRKLGIGPFIKLGVGEEKHNLDDEPKVLAETLEAVIGAIYLDGGFVTSMNVIKKWKGFERFAE